MYVDCVSESLYANHWKGVQVMETISLQCNSLSKMHSSVQAENSMTGRAYMGDLLHRWVTDSIHLERAESLITK